MDKLTKFLNDVMTSAPKLMALNTLIMIAPPKMPQIADHSALNALAYSVAAFFIIICVNFMSPAEPIGVSLSLVALGVSVMFFAVLGFIVNLAAPAIPLDTPGANVPVDTAVSLANKWATYAVYCFFITLGVYAVLYQAVVVVTGYDIYTYCAPYSNNCSFINRFSSIYLIFPAFCSFLGTSILYLMCYFAGRIVDSWKLVSVLYFVTILSVWMCLYLILFVLFV